MSANRSFDDARRHMVDRLADGGISPATQAALAAVPREQFVARFFSYPPSIRFGRPEDVREWEIDDRDPHPDAVALVYDEQRALGIARNSAGRTTSTVSAPSLLASMIDLLELERGMTVLELGAGSGYTAALLAEVVGDPALVTTIDIDEALVDQARANLARTGYGGVTVIASDGDLGVPGARFDRIVATVGCRDVSPRWAGQLSMDGHALIPVQHGGVHPILRVDDDDGTVTSTVVGRSAFVAAQGVQAGTRSPWPRAGRLGPRDDVQRRPLPDEAAVRLRPEPGREVIGGRSLWDFDYHLALCDRRAAYLGSLAASGGRSAAIDQSTAELLWAGPGAEVIAEELLAHLLDWIGIEAPPAAAYTSEWEPIAADREPDDIEQRLHPLESPPGGRRWAIDRVHHRQLVTLDPSRL